MLSKFAYFNAKAEIEEQFTVITPMARTLYNVTDFLFTTKTFI